MKNLRSVGFSDMTALVSGGTAGTGTAVAHQLVERGVRRLALVGRDPTRGDRAREALMSRTPDLEVHYARGDASDPDQIGSLIDAVVDRFGGLDVAVSTVAPSVLPRLMGATHRSEIATQLLEVSLPSILLTHAASKVMRAARGGSIVLVASDAAKVPTPGESVVGAGMAAIGMYARVAAVEGGRDGVRVNVVSPSLIQGTATTELLMGDTFSRNLFEKAMTRAPLGPTSAEDVARLVVFLAGPESSRITGQTLSVNGGLSI